MTELIIPFIIAALIAVIIIQAVERYFFSEQVNRERHDLLKFMLSRNVSEYAQASKIEKEQKVNNEQVSDEVELSEANAEEYERYIKNIIK